jgi:hypothetical protein
MRSSLVTVVAGTVQEKLFVRSKHALGRQHHFVHVKVRAPLLHLAPAFPSPQGGSGSHFFHLRRGLGTLQQK